MLKLQVKEPGEYLMIGDDVKVIFTGWSKNYLRIMVDAPKEVSIVRSRAAEKAGNVEPGRYLSDKEMQSRGLNEKEPESRSTGDKELNGRKRKIIMVRNEE